MEIAFWFLVGLPVGILIWAIMIYFVVIMIYCVVSIYNVIKEMLE